MTIGEHIEELRKRVLYTLYFFGGVFFLTFLFHREVREVAVKPYQDAVRHAKVVLAAKRLEKGEAAVPRRRFVVMGGPSFVRPADAASQPGVVLLPWVVYGVVVDDRDEGLDERPVVLSPQELVFQDIKLAALMALLLSAPMLIYQLWAFVRAGLYESEQRAIAPYLPLAIALFMAGAAFGYFFMVPVILNALLTWGTPSEVVIATRLQEYLSLFYTFTFSLGFIFEIPVVMMMSARIGIVSAKAFLRGWRYAVLAGVVIGAVLNPAPDMLTQILFAAPIVGLYFLGVAFAYWTEGSRRRAAAR